MSTPFTPMSATAAMLLMTGIGLATFGLMVWAILGGFSGVGILLLLLLAILYIAGAWGLHKGDGWGWGAGVFGSVLFWIVGPWLSLFTLLFAGFSVVVFILLLLSREHYGMVRYDPELDAQAKAALRAARTQNPAGRYCPHCGSPQLWIASDGSAYCENCRTGTISLGPAGEPS